MVIDIRKWILSASVENSMVIHQEDKGVQVYLKKTSLACNRVHRVVTAQVNVSFPAAVPGPVPEKSGIHSCIFQIGNRVKSQVQLVVGICSLGMRYTILPAAANFPCPYKIFITGY